MKKLTKTLEHLLELGGVKKDIVLLVPVRTGAALQHFGLFAAAV